MRLPSALALALLALAWLTPSRPARANMARAVFDGERAGAVAPEGSTSVRVDRETLAFTLTEALDHAAVTATYAMTNTGAAAESADVAFVFVLADHRAKGPRVEVDVDGARIPSRTVSDAELLLPRLRAWVSEHAAVERELGAVIERRARENDPSPSLERAVEAAGGRCRFDCADLVRWYRLTHDAALAKEPQDDAIVGAAHDAIPAALDALVAGWSTLGDARLERVFFHLDFAPGQRRAVVVRYDQQAAVDLAAHVNPTYAFDYLLSPAKRWAGFGPLEISVRVPESVRFSSPLPFRLEGDAYRADLPGLPDGELRFEVMPRKGLWFGMTDSGGYWAILIAAMALTALGVGVAMGRRRAPRPRWSRVALRLLGAGLLAAACNVAVLVLLTSAFPPHGLGFGYGGILGGLLLLVLSVPAGAGASGVTASLRAREAPLE